MNSKHLRQPASLVAVGSLLLAVVFAADGRTVLKPGWNMFSTAQDVEVGPNCIHCGYSHAGLRRWAGRSG